MPVTTKAQNPVRGGATKTLNNNAVGSVKNAPTQSGDAGGGGDPAAAINQDDDEAIAAFFQEMRQDDDAVAHEIRKVSMMPGQKMFKLGPDFVDDEYFECTPVPLYTQTIPLLDYDSFLEKSPDELIVVTPIRPQTFSALFAFYRDRGPAFNWDPNLTDLEEDCFFQEVINFPTSKLAYAIARERKRDRVKKRRVKVFKPSGDFVIKTRLYMTLTESPTIFLLQIPGDLVLESDENFAATKAKNEKYLLMVKHHLESDTYANDYAQSFENYKLNTYTDYKIRGCTDVGTDCHFYFIHDEYKKVAAEDIKRQIRENDELTAKILAEKARLDIPETGLNSSDSEDSSDEEDDTTFRVDISKYKEEEEEESRQNLLEDASEDEIPMSSDDDDEFEIRLPLQTVYDRKHHHSKQKGPRIYPDVSFSIIALERIICMDSQQQKQADMRGFTEPEEIKPLAVIQEDVDVKSAEVLDEDAVVDLLLKQHRMQEQESGDESRGKEQDYNGVPPELRDLDFDETDDGNGDADDQGKTDAKKEAPKEEAVEVDEEEKDAFDLAVEGTLIETDEGSTPGPTTQTGKSDRGGAEIPDGSERQDTSGTKEKQEDSINTSDQYKVDDNFPKSEGDDAHLLGNIRCEWNEKAEKNTDMKEEQEEAAANEEIILDEKMTLLAANDDDNQQIAVTNQKPQEKRKEVIQEFGYNFPELMEKTQEQKDKEEKAAKDKEEEEKDDISDESEIEEDSQLSDHKLLDEGLGDSSDSSSADSVIDFRELVTRRSSAGKIFGAQKEIKIDPNLDLSSEAANLRAYWQFKAKETHGMEVTDIALHPSNGNVIAVSYGTARFGKESDAGVVCIWNAKNNRSPERLYKFKSPATTLAFSEFTPYVLAVGMLDGNIVLYDVRESDSVILGTTFAQDDKHMGPIWLIYWLVEEDSSNEASISESMLSLGDDGYLKKWSMAKGLESQDVMKVMRSTMQIPGRREKRSESLITTLSNAYTVCFFPDNTDLFLMGTEEGFIHKCATAYKDQYVSTYVGHTGPVYRICFSTFDESVFVSCGGDWTVKIWRTEHQTPLLSMHTGHRTIFDVACSLYSSTVFICCAELHIEVWDLSLNTLEPVVNHQPPFNIGLRKVAFNGLLNSVIIGDDEGAITIFGLRGFPRPPNGRGAQNEALMEALLPGTKRRNKNDMSVESNNMSKGSQLLKGGLKGKTVPNSGPTKVTEDYGRNKSVKY